MDVSENQVHRNRGLEDGHGLVAGRGFEDLKPALPQIIGNYESDQDLILGDQNGRHPLLRIGKNYF